MNIRTTALVTGPVFAAAVLLGACSSDSTTTAASSTTAAPTTTAPTSGSSGTSAMAADDIVAVAVENGNFTVLAELLTEAGLVETLQGEGPFTVFAPTDDAFAKVDPATLEALKANPDQLKAVLTYHVVPGEVLAADVVPGEVATVEGSDLTITVDGSTVKINDATVTTADVMASNGVIHVIDTVLIPPTSGS